MHPSDLVYNRRTTLFKLGRRQQVERTTSKQTSRPSSSASRNVLRCRIGVDFSGVLALQLHALLTVNAKVLLTGSDQPQHI